MHGKQYVKKKICNLQVFEETVLVITFTGQQKVDPSCVSKIHLNNKHLDQLQVNVAIYM